MRFTTSPGLGWFLTSSEPSARGVAPIGNLNSNIKIKIYPEWYRQVTLEWTIPESWAGAKFNIYFWPGGNEAYRKLNTALVTNLFFSDPTTRDYSKMDEGYYIVEAILPFTSEVVMSYPTSWSYVRRDKTEKIANEIQRREYLLLSKFVGVKTFFFRKKTYGLRCPRCWSESNEKVMDDHCEVCFGTSFDGGYYDPIPVFIQYDVTRTDRQKTYQGLIEPNTMNAWTISVPGMNPDDVLIRVGSWSVYKVLSSSPTELQSVTVRQILAISQLGRSDVENKLVKKIEATLGPYYLDYFDSKFTKKRFPQNLLDANPNNDQKWSENMDKATLPMYNL